MTHTELNQYILHYVEKDQTHSAIMLTAPWGTGKSYYIQNELKPFLEREEKGNHKCIVVSLYGLNDLFGVSKAIYLESRMKFLNASSEKAVTSRFAAKTVWKGVTSFFGIDLSKSNEEMQELYQSVDLSGKLIVLEDLERSGIDILEVLGYVNNLVEQDNVKVLLVANENEIIKTVKKEGKDKDGKSIVSLVKTEKTKQYLRTKEKTVSDTVQFYTGFEKPIEEIIRSYNCDFFNLMLDRKNQFADSELVHTILNIMTTVKSFNLRSIIFGCQKTFDLLQYVDESYSIAFLEFLLCSNIAFALRLKESDDLQWKKEDDYCSASLGTYTFPLLKVAYNYIKYQNCDRDELKKANDLYCRQKEYEKTKKTIKEQLDIIYQYYRMREIDVSNALSIITRNLETSEDIPCGEFGKLANYLVAIHKAIGRDDDISRCRDAMIKRIKECESSSLEDDLRIHDRIQLFSSEENTELSQWSEDMLNACRIRQQAQITFDYQPENAEQFVRSVRNNRDKYLSIHAFAKKLDVKRLIIMISNSSPSQIDSIRNAFLDVYSFSNLNEFFEEDKESLETIKKEIDKLIKKKKEDDKIVLLQLQYFSENLESIIERL